MSEDEAASVHSAQNAGPAPVGQPTATLARVSIKAPEFSEASATGWFTILEAQFNLSHITVQSTQFFHAVSALPPTLINRLPISILNNRNYDELKATILNYVEKSKPELFESLMTPDILTGRPSVCLANLQRTAAKVNIGEEFVRHRFLQSLPTSITPVLASQSTLCLEQLGNLADELVS